MASSVNSIVIKACSICSFVNRVIPTCMLSYDEMIAANASALSATKSSTASRNLMFGNVELLVGLEPLTRCIARQLAGIFRTLPTVVQIMTVGR